MATAQVRVSMSAVWRGQLIAQETNTSWNLQLSTLPHFVVDRQIIHVSDKSLRLTFSVTLVDSVPRRTGCGARYQWFGFCIIKFLFWRLLSSCELFCYIN